MSKPILIIGLTLSENEKDNLKKSKEYLDIEKEYHILIFNTIEPIFKIIGLEQYDIEKTNFNK